MKDLIPIAGRVSRRALAAGLAVLLWPAPASSQEYVAVHAGRVIVGNGDELENVTIVIEDGKIQTIDPEVELPFPCEVVNARDLTVMPGLIHPHSRLSLLSYSRSGLQTHRRVAEEFLPRGDEFEDALKAGFTTLALAPPTGSGLPGRALVVRTADVGQGWVVQEVGYTKVQMMNPAQDRPLLADALKKAREAIERETKAREEWEAKKKAAEEEARKKEAAEAKPPPEKPPEGGAEEEPSPPPADQQAAEKPAVEEFQPPAIPPELQPLVDLLREEAVPPALIQVDGASTYLHLQKALDDHEITYALLGNNSMNRHFWRVHDLFLAAEELGEAQELVLLTPNLNYYPATTNRVNPLRLLHDAGARVGFVPRSDGAEDLAGMRFQVGEVIVGGLPREVAVPALTLRVAEAIGLADRLGTVETGKDANLQFLSGDPFDVQTRVERVMVEGVMAYSRDEEEQGR